VKRRSFLGVLAALFVAPKPTPVYVWEEIGPCFAPPPVADVRDFLAHEPLPGLKPIGEILVKIDFDDLFTQPMRETQARMTRLFFPESR
jgi:hypothetical protein